MCKERAQVGGNYLCVSSTHLDILRCVTSHVPVMYWWMIIKIYGFTSVI